MLLLDCLNLYIKRLFSQPNACDTIGTEMLIQSNFEGNLLVERRHVCERDK
jgi:hypothetical protein